VIVSIIIIVIVRIIYHCDQVQLVLLLGRFAILSARWMSNCTSFELTIIFSVQSGHNKICISLKLASTVLLNKYNLREHLGYIC